MYTKVAWKIETEATGFFPVCLLLTHSHVHIHSHVCMFVCMYVRRQYTIQ